MFTSKRKKPAEKHPHTASSLQVSSHVNTMINNISSLSYKKSIAIHLVFIAFLIGIASADSVTVNDFLPTRYDIHTLDFSPQTFPLSKNVNLWQSSNQNKSAPAIIYAYDDYTFYEYQYDVRTNTWIENWKSFLTKSENRNATINLLYISKPLNNGIGLMVFKTEEGIHFYQYGKKRLELISKSEYFVENLFNDFYGWHKPNNILKFGNFYHQRDLIGMLTKHEEYNTTFFQIKTKFVAGEYPIEALEFDESTIGDISNANFFLADLQRKGQENIIIHHREGLNIYQFNEPKKLEHLMLVPNSAKSDDDKETIFFPTLTNQLYQDIVLINSSGLFIYQYTDDLKNYKFIHHTSLFATLNGWNSKYWNTIQFQDVNSDGKQEMLFTGPQGINLYTFNDHRNQWFSVLDNSPLTIDQFHSNIIKVLPASSTLIGYPVVFTHYEDKLHWAYLIDLESLPYGEKTDETFQEETKVNTSPPIPLFLEPERNREEKTVLLIRDTLDDSFINEAFDDDTGKAMFKLPLIDVPNRWGDMKLNFYYSDTNEESGILGTGWSLSQSVIIMDHQSSVFPEDEIYYLILHDMHQQLQFDSENSTDTVHVFRSPSVTFNWQIRYFKNEQRWEIYDQDSSLKQIYGRSPRNENAIFWDLKWENWRGVGSSSKARKQLANAWYLVEMKDKDGNKVKYTYDTIDIPVPGSKSFTREIYLKAITDNLKGEVIFNYLNKTTQEYILPSLEDNNNLNMNPVQTRYISGYKLNTMKYQQNVDFVYRIEDGKRFLTEIRQQGDITDKPVLQFRYKKYFTSYFLQNVILPNNVDVEFHHQALGEVSSRMTEIAFRLSVPQSAIVDYSSKDVLLTYPNERQQIVMRIFNHQMTEELYSSVPDSNAPNRLPVLGRDQVKSHDVVYSENFLVVVLNYLADKELYIFHKEQNQWMPTPTYYIFNIITDLRFGEDFILVKNPDSTYLEIIDWNDTSKKWQKERFSQVNSKSLLFTTYQRTFVCYDDQNLWIAYRNFANKWQSKLLKKIPGIISDIKETLNKFDLNETDHQTLLNTFQSTALQLNNNLLILNRWRLVESQLYFVIDSFTLNSRYEIASEKQFITAQDNLNTLSSQVEENGTNITVAYKKTNNKFEIFAKSIRNCNAIKKENSNYKICTSQKDKDLKSATDDLRKLKPFIIDISKYQVILNSPVMLCKNESYIFDGNDWNTKIINDFPIPLGNAFVIDRENEKSSFKLYRQNKNGTKQSDYLVDLNITQLQDTMLRNHYPAYLAYQQNGKQINVIEFSNDGTIPKTYQLPSKEKISQWSNYPILVTQIDNSDDKSTLIFRPQTNINRLLPNTVIRKTTMTLNNGHKQVTGYEYDESSAKLLENSIYYERILVIPGDQKTTFGWIEGINDFNNQTNKKRNVFNAEGNLVKTLKEKKTVDSNTTQDENINQNTIIFDKTGKLEVAQFFPNEITDEEVGYYGFEEYEINRIGVHSTSDDKKWLFDKNDISNEKFSLTGRNHLSLTNNTLKGTFRSNYYQKYIASCWMRPQQEPLQLGAITPYLKASVHAENVGELLLQLGEVKFVLDDWAYVEVIVDPYYAKELYLLRTNLMQQSELTLETSVIIASDGNTTIDIDHVRFSPLNSDFQANVYDAETQQITEVIHANGLFEKLIYGKYQTEIANFNQLGELKKFHTYTKASSIGAIVQQRCIIRIQSEIAFYERFSPYSFLKRWQINDSNSWRISPWQLHHFNDLHTLKLYIPENPSSYGIRICYSLLSHNSVLKFDNIELRRTTDKAYITVLEKKQIPLNGEILIIIEHNRLLAWIDGNLYFDQSTNTVLSNISIGGDVTISDIIVFNEPSVEVTYLNDLGEKLQVIKLVNANTATVTEYVYDELGREAIVTQPALMENIENEPIMAYYNDFITNDDPLMNNSIWKSEKLQGTATTVISEYGYRRTKYNANPLDETCVTGLPGKEFLVSGPYAKRFASSTEKLFITNLFPKQNHNYHVEYKSGGVEDISVYDANDHKVARFVDAPSRRSLLSTYKYNDNGKLIEVLPPMYHQMAQTTLKFNPPSQLSDEEEKLQKSFGMRMTYDKKGKLISKKIPDSGKVEYIYNDDESLKFTVYYSRTDNEEIESIIYLNYDLFGRLNSIGELKSRPSREQLNTFVLSENNTREYQQLYYGDYEKNPILRKNVKRSITFNDDTPLIEESIMNAIQETTSKRIIIPNNDNSTSVLAVNKIYIAEKLKSIVYPIDFQGTPLKLTYQYDKLGYVREITIPEKSTLLANFTYNSAGQVVIEHHLPEFEKNFTRQYDYNAPGFLTRLSDKFLTEQVSYTNGSYGGYGYGDGTVTRTEFRATWHQYCDNSGLGLNEKSFISNSITAEESALCYRKLKNAGYLNERNIQSKIFYSTLEPDFPVVCGYGTTGRQVQLKLGEKGYPTLYGHSYDYGSLQELTKAKYFIGDDAPLPLQPGTFAKEIQGINSTDSMEIWLILKQNGYITQDKDKIEVSLTHGKKGKSIIRSSLYEDLFRIQSDHSYVMYELLIERILSVFFYQKQNSVFQSKLRAAIVQWNNGILTEKLQLTINQLVRMLEQKQYFHDLLAENFNEKLKRYQPFIRDIVRVLSQYSAKQLGEAEFDVQSYDIDVNGNHKLFYSTFDRYELTYNKHTNQIDQIKFDSFAKPALFNFSMKHDSRGNVIRAPHKNINHIEYDPVSNRATKFHLSDGRTVTLHYDAAGERVLKRVSNNQSQPMKEIRYMRDELGRTLVEHKITYLSPDVPPDVLITAYIYGPIGLLGFIRQDEFYSVITDHEGSVRLIVNNGEVVAAYDYLPYGNLMREYGNNIRAKISYLYTGKEWDEELALYNFHVRFYDPSIGRFYQIDPKEQYFSPYKFAGNSPVSTVDPNGEFAFPLFLEMLGFGMTYQGVEGAAYNNDWNHVTEDNKSPKTWLNKAYAGVKSVLTSYIPKIPNVNTYYETSTTTHFTSPTTTTNSDTFVMNGISTNWDSRKPGKHAGMLLASAAFSDIPEFAINNGKCLFRRTQNIRQGVIMFRDKGNIQTNIIIKFFDKNKLAAVINKQTVNFFKDSLSKLLTMRKAVGNIVGGGATTLLGLINILKRDGRISIHNFQDLLTVTSLGPQYRKIISTDKRAIAAQIKNDILRVHEVHKTTSKALKDVVNLYTTQTNRKPTLNKTLDTISTVIFGDEKIIAAFSGLDNPRSIIYNINPNTNAKTKTLFLEKNYETESEKTIYDDDRMKNAKLEEIFLKLMESKKQESIQSFDSTTQKLRAHFNTFLSKGTTDKLIHRIRTEIIVENDKPSKLSNLEKIFNQEIFNEVSDWERKITRWMKPSINDKYDNIRRLDQKYKLPPPVTKDEVIESTRKLEAMFAISENSNPEILRTQNLEESLALRLNIWEVPIIEKLKNRIDYIQSKAFFEEMNKQLAPLQENDVIFIDKNNRNQSNANTAKYILTDDKWQWKIEQTKKQIPEYSKVSQEIALALSQRVVPLSHYPIRFELIAQNVP